MAQNLAIKYSPVVAERFKRASITDVAVNQEYDFIGVKTVNVYSIGTAELGNYTRSGANRYGTPSELNDTKQELSVTQDKSFTFTLDRGNFEENQMVTRAGEALAREIDEVIVPTVDAYRLSVMKTSAGTTAYGVISKANANAYETFLDGCVALNENKVPLTSRVAFVSSNFYKCIRLDQAFIKASDMAQDMLVKGSVGMIEGVNIIPAGGYLPTNVEFIIAHPSATVAPNKLQSYYIHENPAGIDGWLVEGRNIYDAFVLTARAKGVYVHIGTQAPAQNAGSNSNADAADSADGE